MFPITANANKNHLTYAESAVKKWVENPKNYVWYNVTVTGISANLNGKYKHPANYVNCVFVCSATLTKPDGTMESLNKTIPSEYQVKHTKETTEFNTKTN